MGVNYHLVPPFMQFGEGDVLCDFNGRLVARGDFDDWRKALIQARDPDTRARWAESGLSRIVELGLSSENRREPYEYIIMQFAMTSFIIKNIDSLLLILSLSLSLVTDQNRREP
mgnify:CR=1 FL=1